MEIVPITIVAVAIISFIIGYIKGNDRGYNKAMDFCTALELLKNKNKKDKGL
jgi:hypothetical protein